MGSANGNGAGSAILARLAEMNERVASLEKKLDALMRHFGLSGNGQPATGGNGRGGSGGNVADLRDIQGEYGDPKIGKMPRNWKLENCEGMRASECSPEVLDAWADFLDWKASNPREGKEKYADYDRRDARRCRRWAIEIREGRVKQGQRPAAAPPPGDAQWTRGNGAPPPPDDYGPPPDDGYGPPPSDDAPPFNEDDVPF